MEREIMRCKNGKNKDKSEKVSCRICRKKKETESDNAQEQKCIILLTTNMILVIT